ncbi:MAG TPA: cytidine deaminase [Pseudacidobacterium sp.]|jgi:cytidine deaminase|nr:cytidine deaminase [Pseudacidobacterium sp.]
MPEISSAQIEQLRQAAKIAAENAYAPYSQFCVGAALLFDDGNIVTGCNVENLSYGLTICAERTAIVRAIAESGAQRRIVAVMITNMNQAASPPCGACRQMLSEFVTKDAVVYFADGTGSFMAKPFVELLPCSFADWKADARS